MATIGLTKRQQKKVHRGLCREPFCRNRRRKDRQTCHTCVSRKRRAANPMHSAWRALKDHAKARGIEFTISLEYFAKFVHASDYLRLKGNEAASLTVDRDNNRLGYVEGNLKPLTRSANSYKRAKYDEMRMTHGYGWRNKLANAA